MTGGAPGKILTLLLILLSAPARAQPVALTFDDLPFSAQHLTVRKARHGVAQLARALHACRAPATGFVIGQVFEARPALRAGLMHTWRRNGLALGNHTYSHTSVNQLGARAYIADIARDDRLLRRLTHARPTAALWFRHPYLETGSTLADRDAVEGWLKSHHYRVAPVTLENDDDLFAAPYDAALAAHDRTRALEIRRSYLAFTDRRIAWYQQAAQQLLGRSPALVFLLHASRLNADALPDLCQRLHAHDLTPVTLGRALEDPAYRLPDGPPSRDGDDWLNRWAVVLGRDLPWDSFPEAPPDIQAASARLDPDTH